MELRLTRTLPAVVTLLLGLSACIPSQPVNADYRANFEALWTIIDERYCFLDEKGIDWDSIHTAYSKEIDLMEEQKVTNDLAFFQLMAKMLDELHDGHVNLMTGFDVSANSD